MGIKTTQNFTLISKLLRKTNLQKCLANNFFWVDFFSIISTDLKSALNSANFEYSYAKKEQKNFWGH
jgi:hypothetical protein